jgi:RNA polymerase sigma-70 factor (ECF subfamily)
MMLAAARRLAPVVGWTAAGELEPVRGDGHGAAVAGLEPAQVRDATVAELAIAACAGSPAAFATLYQRFHRAVHAVALARGDVGDAGDVVQDVFADAWQKLPALREPAAFAGWLLTMARHRAIDVARRRRPVASLVEASVPPTPRAEAMAAVAAIRALPETYRETLIMRLVEGLTGPEIAERTGMTPDSVRVHLSRGLKLLRQRLEGEAP